MSHIFIPAGDPQTVARVMGQSFPENGDRFIDPVRDLSTREWEVLACISAGDSNKVIARALQLSPFTVKRHVANILDKLAVVSRGQAAAWYRTRAVAVRAKSADEVLPFTHDPQRLCVRCRKAFEEILRPIASYRGEIGHRVVGLSDLNREVPTRC